VLIFGRFGFPRLEIAGAGWGTFIGISVMAGINMTMLLGSNINSIFKSRRTLNISFSRMFALLKVGLPAGLELMINVAFWGVILFGLVGRFGKEALAATSAIMSYTNVSVMPIVGVSTALTAAVGKTIGHGRKDLVMKQTGVCLRIALVYMGTIGICFLLFREPLMRFWTSDVKVIEAGVNILVCAAVYQVFHAARTIYSGSLRGAGDTVWLGIISVMAAVIILGIGGALVVKYAPSLGAVGPWIAASVSIIAAGLANRWRFRSRKWMEIDLFKRRLVGVPVEV
jgi:MATE family multidrug resistance protein